jgi:MFS transporter, DHA2 family, multidrug resistance protein
MADADIHGPVSFGGIAPRPIFAVFAVMLGAFFTNFDTRLISFALPDLRGAFSLSFDEGAWLHTASVGSQIFIASAVAWLATAFGLRRVLAIPALIYAVVSLAIPFVRNYPSLMVLSVVQGLLLGTFVPATFMIIFRNLPMQWWLFAIAVYSARVGFTIDTSLSIVGFYVERLGWQWMYWQGVILAPLIALLVYLGTPPSPTNRDLVENADWGGMLLLGTSISMIYAGLDQGNRLDWRESGVVMALLLVGGALFILFLINEAVVRRPWANVSVLFNRNIALMLTVVLLYNLTSLSNAILVPNFLSVVTLLRPEQAGIVMLASGAVTILALLPILLLFLRFLDARIALIIGLAAFATANFMGTQLTNEYALGDFSTIVILQSAGQLFTLTAAIVLLVSNADSSRATAFAAYIQIMRVGGTEIGVALMTTLLRVREQVHSNYLGTHVEVGNPHVMQVLNQLGETFYRYGTGTASARALETLATLVAREANVLAYIDGFRLCLWLAIAALLCTALVTRAPPGPFTPVAIGDELSRLFSKWRR